MDDLTVFLQILFWGLYAGCIYILLATGLNLIFGVMKVVNFAHGEFLMLGAYITATIFFLTGINPYLIILLSMLALIGDRGSCRTTLLPPYPRDRKTERDLSLDRPHLCHPERGCHDMDRQLAEHPEPL